MKKVLTVLLVIAVMFTFSFGSSFAATANDETATTTRSEAIAEAQADLIKEVEDAAVTAKKDLADEYTEAIIDADCVIDGSVYAATIDEIVANYKTVINTAAKQVKADTTITGNYTDAIKATAVEVLEYNGKDVAVTYTGITAANLVAMATANDASTDEGRYYVLFTWVNALDSMKSYVIGEIEKIDMSLYTNDVADENDPYEKTWKELAQEAKEDLLDDVEDIDVDMTMNRLAALTELQELYAVLDNLVADETYTDIYGDTYPVTYKFAASYNLMTSDDLADDDAAAEASKATYLAEAASKLAAAKKAALADYQADRYTKDQYNDRLDALDDWEEVNVLLIEEEKYDKLWVASDVATARIVIYEAAEDVADVCKLQVEVDGTAKYDAEKVNDILADLKVAIYAGEETTVTAADFADAVITEDLFAWNKEVKLAQAKDNLEKVLDANEYYDPEVADIEELYAELIEKIEAATTQKQLDTCKVNADTAKVNAVATKKKVETKLAGYTNTAKFVNSVNDYINYYNLLSGAKSYEDAYIEDVTVEDVVEYLAEAGARTNADVADLLNQVEAFAKTVQTKGEADAEQEAAEAAANAAIKALPTVITLEDKAAVENAYELADEAGITSTKLTKAIAAVKSKEEKAIDDMIKALPSKITVDDEAAVEAILAAIDEYEETEMYGDNVTYAKKAKAETAKAAVRAAKLDAVHAAIDAVDASNPASVEAARTLVDAYVAQYTSAVDNDRAVANILNMDKLTYAEAAVAAAEIKAVEALKITAKSTAKKGSITVKWTVKGDATGIDGYQVWKSTKHSKGYKKAFTTTKQTYKNTKGLKAGTRYYYKVRAYKVVDGKNVYSDWSNKARRVAK